MQKDMHFYGTYAVARIAGFSPEEARTIATAAEFVDEAVAATPISLGGQSYMLPVVSAHKMLELGKNSDPMDQWRVWLPFHFLPGGQGNNAEERLTCLWGDPGNQAVDGIIDLALQARANNETYAYHLLGIVTHVIQDTYAHYGFSGIASDLNTVDQSSLDLLNVSDDMKDYIGDKLESAWDRLSGCFAEATKLGHAGVATCPDRPYLEWRFDYEESRQQPVPYLSAPRKNAETFYRACTRLHALYAAFRNGDSSIQAPGGHLEFADDVSSKIKQILSHEGTKKERSDMWRDSMKNTTLFEVVDEDKTIRYSPKGWSVKALKDNPLASTTEAHKYNLAASSYLNKVFDEILPKMGLLTI